MTIEKAREVHETVDTLDRYEKDAQTLLEEMSLVEYPYSLYVQISLHHNEDPQFEPVKVNFLGNGDSWDARIQQAMIRAALAEIETLKQELIANLDAI